MKRAEEVKSVLSDAIRTSIESQGMTQQRVAELIGTTQGRVSNLVNGRIDLFSLDNIVNICGKLGMELTVKVRQLPKSRRYTGKAMPPADYVRED